MDDWEEHPGKEAKTIRGAIIRHVE